MLKKKCKGISLVEILLMLGFLAAALVLAMTTFGEATMQEEMKGWNNLIRSLPFLSKDNGMTRIKELSSRLHLQIYSPSHYKATVSPDRYSFDLRGEAKLLSMMEFVCSSVSQESSGLILCWSNQGASREETVLSVVVKLAGAQLPEMPSNSPEVKVLPQPPVQKKESVQSFSEGDKITAMREFLTSFSLSINKKGDEYKERWAFAQRDLGEKLPGSKVLEAKGRSLLVEVPLEYAPKFMSVCASVSEECVPVGPSRFRVKFKILVDGWDAAGGLE